jgi:hypothetical protein
MQIKSRVDLYKDFLNLVERENRREQSVVNRRIMAVFLWCFILPVICAVMMLILIHLNVVPRHFRSKMDWIILGFPISYAIYFLTSELIRDLPNFFKRGGMTNILKQSHKDFVWRERTIEAIRSLSGIQSSDWKWIAKNYEVDLNGMAFRVKYLTFFAAAVFFLILQGFDSIPSEFVYSVEPVVTPKLFYHWFDSVLNKLLEFASLGIFLGLFYLSGMQSHRNLDRYRECLELIEEDLEPIQDKRSDKKSAKN